eukprot:NODE_612_length_6011_cov_0.245095.p3 type:complete len:125 gc:universal NODE_612_length_6011_cov_0.245095:382-756(+)
MDSYLHYMKNKNKCNTDLENSPRNKAASSYNKMHCLCTCFPKTVSVPVPNCEDCDKTFCLLQTECLHFQNNTDIPQLKGECFSRESLKDEIIISSFLVITSILLLMSVIKILRKNEESVAYQQI